MSINPVQDAALNTLKQYALHLKVTDYFITIKPPTPECKDEITSAFGALSNRINVNLEADHQTIRVNSKTAPDDTTIKQIATMMADAGVNFPGSDRYKTKQIS